MLVQQYSNHLNVCLSHKQNTYSSTAPYPNNSCTSNAVTKELWGKYANDLEMS